MNRRAPDRQIMHRSSPWRGSSILLAVVTIAVSLNFCRAESGESRRVVNVRDFGAKGDCRRVTDGAMNKGSTTLTSGAAHFSQKDVGKPMYVLQAGVEKFPELGEVAGAPLSTLIVAVLDGSTVTLADAARQDVTHAHACWGTDDTAAIRQAIDSLSETGGTVYFPAGEYRVTYQGGPALKVASSRIRLQGSGTASALFNSTVLFKAKLRDGKTITEQVGVPVLYVGSATATIEDVEVDHLWLGDNGQNYNFRDWGPYGLGVLGSSGKIDRFHFHDLTIETSYLCGINTNAETKGFEIDHVTVLDTGDHGFYLAGSASDGDVHDNRLLGTAESPMRQGITIKKKARMRITNNEIAHAEFNGIGVEGDSVDHTSRDVLIADNWLHDLNAWHTDAIAVVNAEDVVIRNNRIEDTSWIAIDIRASLYHVSRVLVKDNVIQRAGKMNPCTAIDVRYTSPREEAAVAPAQGMVSDIVIENNVMVDCAHGLSFVNVSGENAVRGNWVESQLVRERSAAFEIQPKAGATVAFSQNGSRNYGRSTVAAGVTDGGNDLR
jgi:hypothetical protein